MVEEKKELVGNAYSKQVEVLIDGTTFFQLQKEKMGWFADPLKLLEWLEEEVGEISQATYFYRANEAGSKADSFLWAVVHIGFKLNPVPVKEHFYAEPTFNSMTPDIVVEMVARMPMYDHLVLIGNESGYMPAIRRLHSNNKRYTVLGSKSFIDPGLLSLCGQNFIDLEDEEIRTRIQKD